MTSSKINGADASQVSALFTSMYKNGDRDVAIFCHDSPDPDAIASALAMTFLAKKFKLKSTICYGGEIAHTQNKAMINVLALKLVKVSDLLDVHREAIANQPFVIVDTQHFLTGNCFGPQGIVAEGKKPCLVVDHHEGEGSVVSDVSVIKAVASCSTIMTKLLKDCRVKIDSNLATSLYFGLMKDTDELSQRELLTEVDLEIVEYLKSRIDLDLYLRILNCPKPRILIDLMGSALSKYFKQSGNTVVSGVGFLKTQQRSLIAEISDHIISHTGVENCVTMGILDDGIGTPKQLSASFRHTGDVVNANEFAKRIFGKDKGGGRKGSGGAIIPLGDISSMIIDSMSDDQEKLSTYFESVFCGYAERILSEIKI